MIGIWISHRTILWYALHGKSARWHHERWEEEDIGWTKGEEIPTLRRSSIADVYDALTSGVRCYKNAYDRDTAIR